ncbi:MAG: hypothetical protein WDZ84_10565 [Rhodovibrionaceae bacterium]
MKNIFYILFLASVGLFVISELLLILKFSVADFSLIVEKIRDIPVLSERLFYLDNPHASADDKSSLSLVYLSAMLCGTLFFLFGLIQGVQHARDKMMPDEAKKGFLGTIIITFVLYLNIEFLSPSENFQKSEDYFDLSSLIKNPFLLEVLFGPVVIFLVPVILCLALIFAYFYFLSLCRWLS